MWLWGIMDGKPGNVSTAAAAPPAPKRSGPHEADRGAAEEVGPKYPAQRSNDHVDRPAKASGSSCGRTTHPGRHDGEDDVFGLRDGNPTCPC
jgi:hypothetical protein